MLHYAPGKIGKHGFFLSWKILHGQMPQFTFQVGLGCAIQQNPSIIQQ